MSTCFFIGHRETSDSIFPALVQAVERHVTEYGVTEFIVGHYGNFDRLAARAVLKAKEHHPQVTLFLLLPYHPADRPTPAPKGFDGTFYPLAWSGYPSGRLSSGQTGTWRTTVTFSSPMPGIRPATPGSWWTTPRRGARFRWTICGTIPPDRHP